MCGRTSRIVSVGTEALNHQNTKPKLQIWHGVVRGAPASPRAARRTDPVKGVVFASNAQTAVGIMRSRRTCFSLFQTYLVCIYMVCFRGSCRDHLKVNSENFRIAQSTSYSPLKRVQNVFEEQVVSVPQPMLGYTPSLALATILRLNCYSLLLTRAVPRFGFCCKKTA